GAGGPARARMVGGIRPPSEALPTHTDWRCPARRAARRVARIRRRRRFRSQEEPMAADGLIDQYVRALRSRLGARRDRDDLVDEVLDHLLSTTERLEALGIDPHTAARRALARFGEPKLVASLLSDVPSKGNLMSLF